MPLVIDEAWLPATLTAGPMTDEQFGEFCAEHPDCFIEMTAGGEIELMPPNNPFTSAENGEIGLQLKLWARQDRRGVVTDPSGGFVLPNGARRSPDAAWTLKSRLPTDVRGPWHLCPDFVIELRSESDRLSRLRTKMREWIANGAHLAWLIDPERRAVEIYRPGVEPDIHENIDRMAGVAPVAGFELDLRPVLEPLDFA
jgi:Uma2 family endonuclease